MTEFIYKTKNYDIILDFKLTNWGFSFDGCKKCKYPISWSIFFGPIEITKYQQGGSVRGSKY